MRKNHISLLIAVLALIIPALASAQPLPTSSPTNAPASIRSRIKADLEKRMENAQNNQNYRNDLEERGSIMERRLRESGYTDNGRRMLLGMFGMRKNIVTRQLETALNNLVQIRSRIDSRIKAEENNGRNMTNAKNALAIADTKIATAQNAVNALDSYMPSATSTTATTSVTLTAARDLIATAHSDIRDAQNSLHAVVLAIAHSMGLKLGHEDRNLVSTSTATSTGATSTTTSH